MHNSTPDPCPHCDHHARTLAQAQTHIAVLEAKLQAFRDATTSTTTAQQNPAAVAALHYPNHKG